MRTAKGTDGIALDVEKVLAEIREKQIDTAMLTIEDPENGRRAIVLMQGQADAAWIADQLGKEL